MKLLKNEYFYLYPCCKLVYGDRESLIYDFQREKIYPIPNSLFHILQKSVDRPLILKDLYEAYQDEKTINSYFSFLLKNNLGEWVSKDCRFMPISDHYTSPEYISHITIFSKSIYSTKLEEIEKEINLLLCKHLEFIITSEKNSLTITDLKKTLSLFKTSTLRSIDILLPSSSKQFLISEQEIDLLIKNYPILNRISYYKANRDLYVNKKKFWLTKDYYFNNLNSKNYFHKQLFILENGTIKTHPFLGKSYGNINDDSFHNICNDLLKSKDWATEVSSNLSTKNCLTLHHYVNSI